MGAAAGIIGGIASGLSQSGQKDNTNASPQVSHAMNVSNANAQGTPQMIQPVFTPAQSTSPRSSDTEWARLADMAKSLYSKDKEEKPVEKKEAPSANTSNTTQ